MPNWCQNVATIRHDDVEKIDAIENELKTDKDNSGLFQMLRPRPADQDESWYDWNVNNWGTKWEASVYDFERLDDSSIRVNFDTAWGPCTTLYEYLDTEGYEIDAVYNEEGMAFCGRYAFGSDEYYDYSQMDSYQMTEELPSEIVDVFNIIEYKQEWEAENEESSDDGEDEQPSYEMTEWFDVKTKPAHVGLYDVQYDKANAWPFPSRLTWTGKKWINGQDEVRKDVGKWRGITQSEHNMLVELQKLKDEFDNLLVEKTE
jgi:hypothetical protein